jgi:hypothetical protein
MEADVHVMILLSKLPESSHSDDRAADHLINRVFTSNQERRLS